MKVLAVDPGYDRLGVAVMEHADGKEKLLFSGCIESDKTDTVAERLHTIGTEFQKFLKKHEPDAVGIETLFFNTNQKTAIVVAEARGVVLYLAHAAGCTVHEFGPQQIKVAVTGYGKSDKRAVLDMVKRLVPEAPPKALDDEYDAIAIGITTLMHNRS